jgi:pyrrolidone-carboxylate peptidase
VPCGEARRASVSVTSAPRADTTFRCPDQRGWQPSCQPIEPDRPLTFTRRTPLPVPALAALLGAQFAVRESLSAGLFVCNWT